MHPQYLILVDELRNEIAGLQDTIADLQQRIDRQALLMRALFLLLIKRAGLTEQELLDSFHRCELETASQPVKKCVSCGRAVNLRNNRCMYCDQPSPVDSAFDFLRTGIWLDQPPPPPKKRSRKKPPPLPSDGITILED